jgi:cell division protein FtsL
VKRLHTFLTALSLCFFGLSPQSHAQIQDKESLEMSVLAEQRIQKSVDNLLGPDSRAVVTVFIQNQKTEAIQATENENPLDVFWYLPGSYIQNANPIEEKSEIKKAEVVIQVEEEVPQESQNQIVSIAKRVLRGIDTEVEVVANLEAPMAPPTQASREPASFVEEEKEKTELQKQLEKIQGAESIIAGILVLLGLLLAFGFLGLMLKSSANSLTEGIKQISTKVSNSGSQKIEVSQDPNSLLPTNDENEAKSDEKNRPLLPPHPFVGVEAETLIHSLEAYIKNSPIVFMRSVSEEAEDLLGLKFLISKISPEARQRVKEILGAEHILKAAAFQTSGEVIGFDARGWTQGLIEKIEIKILSGQGVVEEALDPEESLILASCPADSLFAEALKSQNPVVWRIATDFLSPSFLKSQSSDLDDDALKQIVSSAEVEDIEALSEAAKNLVEKLRLRAVEENVLGSSRSDALQHFNIKLLPAIAESVLSRELGEDDAVLESLIESSPDYQEILNEKIWTPSKLRQIPDDSLKEIFARIDEERKAYIIFKLPNEHKERLTGFVPKGNTKRIVLDLISKLEKTATDKKHEEMKNLTREFLDHLRGQHSNGKLALEKSAQSIVSEMNQEGRKAS